MLTTVSKEVLNHLMYAQFDQERFVAGLPASAQPYVQTFLNLYPTGLKTCIKCNSSMCLSRFAVKRAARGQLSGTCKECQKKASRTHYEENTAEVIARSHERNVKQIQSNKDLVIAHCRSHSCTSCGQQGHWAFNKLHSTARPIYELVFGAYGHDTIKEALKDAMVFCKPCTEQHKLEVRKINAQCAQESNFLHNTVQQLSRATHRIAILEKEVGNLARKDKQTDVQMSRLGRLNTQSHV